MVNRFGRLLIGQRFSPKKVAQNGGPGWQFPQGGVEEGEDFAQAALREANEEMGLDPNNLEVVRELGGPVSYTVPFPSFKQHFGVDGQTIQFFLILSKTDSEEVVMDQNPDGHPEFYEHKWMPYKDWDTDLAPYVVDFKRPAYEQIKPIIFETIEANFEAWNQRLAPSDQ